MENSKIPPQIKSFPSFVAILKTIYLCWFCWEDFNSVVVILNYYCYLDWTYNRIHFVCNWQRLLSPVQNSCDFSCCVASFPILDTIYLAEITTEKKKKKVFWTVANFGVRRLKGENNFMSGDLPWGISLLKDHLLGNIGPSGVFPGEREGSKQLLSM